jgi:hypothetical protein
MCSTYLKWACVGFSLAAACALAPAVAGLPRNPDWLLFPETYKAAITADDRRARPFVRRREERGPTRWIAKAESG